MRSPWQHVIERSPLTEEYREGANRFSGRILKVTIETKPAGRS